MDNHFGADKERQVKKGLAWSKFRDHLASNNPGLDIDAILTKTEVRKEPVISYGVLEFVVANDSHGCPCVYFHVFRRRHTIEYGILIQGYAQKNQLFHLICLLSRDERERILNNEWQDLWDDYWIDHSSSGYTNLQAQSKRRFPEIKEILRIINDDIDCKIEQRPYIFPKGKPDKNETGLQAALREAQEETKVSFTVNSESRLSLKASDNAGSLYFSSPIIQQYSGSDDRPYIDYYYVWQRDKIYSCPTQKLATIRHVLATESNDSSIEDDQPYTIVSGIRSPGRSNENISDKFIREETPRLRNKTISHELEADAWIELPLFKTNRERLEWISLVDPFRDYHLFKRHFQAILDVHNHLCFEL